MTELLIRRPRCLQTLATAFVVLAVTCMAQAVDIVATLTPAGPIGLGDEVTVNLSLSGWDAVADGEVDAVDFVVDFDTALFSFVGGSGAALDDGTEFLAQPNQQGDYTLVDDTNDFLVSSGRWGFGAFDDGFDALDGGSAAAGGPLGSFRLLAIGIGTGAIIPAALGADLFGVGDHGAVFTNPEGDFISLSSELHFSGASLTVVPEPAALSLMMLPLALWRRRRFAHNRCDRSHAPPGRR